MKRVGSLYLNVSHSPSMARHLRARSAPPCLSTFSVRGRPCQPLIDPACCERHYSLLQGRCGAPTPKAPPPLPAHLLHGTSRPSVCCKVLPIRFACTGRPVLEVTGRPLELALDFTHTIKDVENCLHHALRKVKAIVHCPVCTSSADHILTLCANQHLSHIEVVLQPSDGKYTV